MRARPAADLFEIFDNRLRSTVAGEIVIEAALLILKRTCLLRFRELGIGRDGVAKTLICLSLIRLRRGPGQLRTVGKLTGQGLIGEHKRVVVVKRENHVRRSEWRWI